MWLVPLAASALLACSSLCAFAAKLLYRVWLAKTVASLARTPIAAALDGLAALLLRVVRLETSTAWALIPKLAALATDDSWPWKRQVHAGRFLSFATAVVVAALV